MQRPYRVRREEEGILSYKEENFLIAELSGHDIRQNCEHKITSSHATTSESR